MGSIPSPRLLRLFGFIAALFVVGSASLQAADMVSLADVARHASEQTKLTSGNKPFHLKASIVETTNPDSEYQGELEEYWVSPQKWRREIRSAGFSQTMVVNGDKVSEVDTGDYYPFWLRELVTAIFDPLPMVQEIKHLDAQIEKPVQAKNENACAHFESTAGIAPVQNKLSEIFCFEGDYGLPRSVMTPGYQAEFRHYKTFGKKWIAQTVSIDPEPGTTIEARIVELVELGELSKPDETLFSVEPATAPEAQLKSIRVQEAALRKLAVKTPAIVWPAAPEGKTSGALSLYVSIDREGNVHEAWPLNPDNGGLNEAAGEQVRKWKFKPAVFDNTRVQIEGVLTFAFDARTEPQVPTGLDAEKPQ